MDGIACFVLYLAVTFVMIHPCAGNNPGNLPLFNDQENTHASPSGDIDIVHRDRLATEAAIRRPGATRSGASVRVLQRLLSSSQETLEKDGGPKPLSVATGGGRHYTVMRQGEMGSGIWAFDLRPGDLIKYSTWSRDLDHVEPWNELRGAARWGNNATEAARHRQEEEYIARRNSAEHFLD